ncbi:MAG: class I SAM-dependent methyltransferase [Gemmata sp.]
MASTVTPQPSAPPHAPVPAANTQPKSKGAPNDTPAAAPKLSKGPDWWLMMRAFLTQGRRVASFAPSSRSMARKLLDGIDWGSASSIVELGAGTGPITAEMVKLASPNTRIVVIELDPTLCGRLQERFRGTPNVEVILGDATRFGDLLAARGIQKVDHVLSGLPLPSFPAAARDAILETASRTISDGGTFRQLTVMPLIYYKLYRRYFEDVRFRFVPVNLPPGGVYVCRGYRGSPTK